MNETMRREALAVCRLLGDAASGRPLAPSDTLPEESAIHGFARAHKLVTLVGAALPPNGFDDIHRAADEAAMKQLQIHATEQVLYKRFAEKHLEFISLKGAALQEYYPEGWIRTATDIDLYVPTEQTDRAADVLHDMGFSVFELHGNDRCFHKPPHTQVELHSSLGGFTKKQQQSLARLTQTAFTVNEHYAYTLFHLYKHFVQAGAGVRMFFDVYCLTLNAAFDRTRTQRLLDELGLLDFERAVHRMNGILFDGDEIIDSMTDAVDFVLQSTAFGTYQAQQTLKAVNSGITGQNHTHTWIVDHGFDRNAMIHRYPSLEKHMWLYPAYCVRRVLHGVFYKTTLKKVTSEAALTLDSGHMRRVLKTMNIL